ncbi:MAG: hypothetical protein E6J76_09850 [Deltaproteobacteria bacterium]|nr:MAG: hypothetical protein E6J76_09850 [Deltaproteobacteria bacterium]
MNGILYDILHILFKRKAVIGVALLVVIAPVALMAFLRPLVFRAYVRLSVTQARAYPQISSRDEPRNLPLVDLTLINAAVNNIKSDDFIQSSAESIVKAGFPAGESGQSAKDWWTQKLTTGLEVTPIPSTPLIDVAYRAYPAQLAADLVNTIAKRYLQAAKGRREPLAFPGESQHLLAGRAKATACSRAHASPHRPRSEFQQGPGRRGRSGRAHGALEGPAPAADALHVRRGSQAGRGQHQGRLARARPQRLAPAVHGRGSAREEQRRAVGPGARAARGGERGSTEDAQQRAARNEPRLSADHGSRVARAGHRGGAPCRA